MNRRQSARQPIAVVVLVGPKPLELERLQDLADSLAAHESGPGWFVMVDDAPEPRRLDELVAHQFAGRSDLKPVSVHHLRDTKPIEFRDGGALCSPVMLGLQWVQANTNARFTLKFDTDSLVIAPFSEQLINVFDADPTVGMIGAHTLTPNHTTRTWNFHADTVRRMINTPPFEWRRPWKWFRGKRPESHVANLIRTALEKGYDPGEHCLGGGYALPAEALDRMAKAGYLNDPMAWMHVDMAEDVMVGVHVRAVGLLLANYVGKGEVFGTRYQGLPALPEVLVERGFSIIHSVKNDPRIDEPGIRAFFKQQREASAAEKLSAKQAAWRSSLAASTEVIS